MSQTDRRAFKVLYPRMVFATAFLANRVALGLARIALCAKVRSTHYMYGWRIVSLDQIIVFLPGSCFPLSDLSLQSFRRDAVLLRSSA